MYHKTPQERLEIKEFILDSNLFLISSSLSMVLLLSFFMYYIICLLFYKGAIDYFIFLSTTFLFIDMLLFAFLAIRNIRTQKRYISRLDTVFEDIELEDKS